MKQITSQHSDQQLADAMGRLIAHRLQTGIDDLPRDITERLKVSRIQALAHQKKTVQTTHVVLGRTGEVSLRMGRGLSNFMTQLGSWLPLLVLVTGMIVISIAQDDMHTQELADVDAELLTDALPPAAYSDPGFAQFLRNNQDK